ncbi:TIGR03862 family flavoprotein [Phytopseudomonas dryadis]|uniref:Aminoacetone oxidase family FAD-binding enzyme n=1 Tax=Phytopseudomonas dryadis TaxID=2487520 RepID=A0A4Q9QZI7_9GAMM|nr:MULTISPECIES: TIGR03862 family flavoprotein [Pseudomonas]TBU90939.1 aminoacetone oxidase family FAD-binding enzyme [Pseudomonas dryadis]TBV08906.1 aminoacetone oxidase family FAD-binding enzyme [Pseudomonas dryadis]TBV15091.1 aminoacetone oxidase family FAD-binding enzyme [Pseudomonas sp. FRB 230]
MTDTSRPASPSVAIIGGGPAGLMAAEVLATAGIRVDLYDAMPSVGRKFLLAGVGGMNITHSEARGAFLARYGERREEIARLLAEFDADALRRWIHDLGIDTFVGTSGRVFPTDMKAAPLLRAWLKRLRELGVQLHTRHRWPGWNADGGLRMETAEGERPIHADAVLLALGGGSWPRLGSDGSWVAHLQQAGVPIAPLQPSNCGFDVAAWSPLLRDKFAGAPLKNVALGLTGEAQRQGEFVLTATGIEGSLVYALSAGIRQRISRDGSCTVCLDLLPQRSEEALGKALSKPRGSHSMAKHLHRQAGLDGVKAALLRELAPAEHFADPLRLAAAIKALPIELHQPRPLAEAISSAGGVPFEALDKGLMLTALPGTFCAGEMLDWEAPTGGYLLTACFASGRAAGLGIAHWLQRGA